MPTPPRLQKLRVVFGEDGEQPDRREGLDRESQPQPLVGQPVERQVDGKEGQAEAQAKGIMQQEGHAGDAAGEQSGLGEQHHAERGEHGAGEKALCILEQRMPRRFRIPDAEIHACPKAVHPCLSRAWLQCNMGFGRRSQRRSGSVFTPFSPGTAAR
jgi:hypothetical protein